MKKIVSIFICSILLFGCGNKENKTGLIIGGSTSIQPLIEVIAESFNEEYSQHVSVQGGGSSVGTKGAMDKTFNIGMCSRNLHAQEAENLEAITIAIDGIAVIVNKNNMISDLTLQEIEKIYTGEITNWSELGGKNQEIAVVSREEGSGTRDGFESVVGFDSEELIENAEIQNATGAVITSVKGNENAIGYISLGSLNEEVKTLKVNGVEANETTIKDKTYLLQRPFILVMAKEETSTEDFMQYIFSDKGRAIIEEHNYIAVEKQK